MAFTQRGVRLLVVLCGLLTGTIANATPVEAVWHCSRGPVGETPNDADGFRLSSVEAVNDTIRVTLTDLIAVYSGHPVKVANRPLHACFMPGNEALSRSALRELGLNPAALQILARRSAIVQRQLEVVTDEAGMLSCMKRNPPAFGYFSQPLDHPQVARCF